MDMTASVKLAKIKAAFTDQPGRNWTSPLASLTYNLRTCLQESSGPTLEPERRPPLLLSFPLLPSLPLSSPLLPSASFCCFLLFPSAPELPIAPLSSPQSTYPAPPDTSNQRATYSEHCTWFSLHRQQHK